MQWWVGNGASIKIYEDAWLLSPHSCKVISPRDFLDVEARVSVLIDQDRKCWNVRVIDNIFLPFEASLIKAIPFSHANCEDLLFWLWNPNGIFSVKSGYKLLLESGLEDLPTSSDPSMSKKVWNEKSDLSDLFAMTTSLIWTRRNQLRVGESTAPVDRICSLAMDNLQDFQRASPPPLRSSRSVRPAKWSPPPPGWFKINFDGATFSSKSLVGLGVIIRNDKGLVMAAYTQSIPLPTFVEMVEVLVARSAISFARELQFDQVIVEGDSEVIINAISKGGFSSSSFGHIIRDIKLSIPAFQNISFSHTLRLGNKLAHRLARMACNFSPFHV
nr:putative ribonuclease h protein [Quercus suber]